MKKHPIITIPDTSANLNAGLVLGKNGIWYAAYTEDGKRKRRSTKTDDPIKARRRRNAIYVKLLAAGATVARKGPKPADTMAKRRQRVQENPDRYLKQSKGVQRPWTVWLNCAQVAGPFETKEQAVKARDKAIGMRRAKR